MRTFIAFTNVVFIQYRKPTTVNVITIFNIPLLDGCMRDLSATTRPPTPTTPPQHPPLTHYTHSAYVNDYGILRYINGHYITLHTLHTPTPPLTANLTLVC